MSIDTMNRVWKHSTASGGALLVLLALADSADERGYCWPSRTTISEKARLKERQVVNVLATLVAAGELAYLPGAGRGHLSMYVVLSGLAPTEAAERVQGLQGKAEETLQRLQGFRSKRAQQLHRSEVERVQSVQIKGAMPIAVSPVLMPDHDLNHHDDPSCSESPPPPSLISMDAQAAASPPTGMDSQRAPAAPAGGGGESAKGIGRNAPPTPEHPDTVAYLANPEPSKPEWGMFKAAAYGHVPLAIAKLAHKQARTKPNGQSVPALTANLLDMWTAGTWQPAPPPPPRSAPPPAPAEPPLTAEQRQANARQMLELAREMIPHLAGGVRP